VDSPLSETASVMIPRVSLRLVAGFVSLQDEQVVYRHGEVFDSVPASEMRLPKLPAVSGHVRASPVAWG
jgi:hypothetical protein